MVVPHRVVLRKIVSDIVDEHLGIPFDLEKAQGQVAKKYSDVLGYYRNATILDECLPLSTSVQAGENFRKNVLKVKYDSRASLIEEKILRVRLENFFGAWLAGMSLGEHQDVPLFGKARLDFQAKLKSILSGLLDNYGSDIWMNEESSFKIDDKLHNEIFLIFKQSCNLKIVDTSIQSDCPPQNIGKVFQLHLQDNRNDPVASKYIKLGERIAAYLDKVANEYANTSEGLAEIRYNNVLSFMRLWDNTFGEKYDIDGKKKDNIARAYRAVARKLKNAGYFSQYPYQHKIALGLKDELAIRMSEWIMEADKSNPIVSSKGQIAVNQEAWTTLENYLNNSISNQEKELLENFRKALFELS